MLIKFKLDGVERVIRQNGTNGFIAYVPGTKDPLGYYSTLKNAVIKHIKDAAILNKEGCKEVIELEGYVNRHKDLIDEFMGLSEEDISKRLVFSDTDEGVRRISEEQKAKTKATKEANKLASKEPKIETPVEDDDDL